MSFKIDTIAEIEALNSKGGFHFFDSDTLHFFKSRVLEPVIKHRYFITTEKSDHDAPRRASIRMICNNGSTETVGEFQGFTSPASARKNLEKGLSAGMVVKNDPYEGAKEPESEDGFNWRAYVGELPIGPRTSKAEAEQVRREALTPAYCDGGDPELDQFVRGYLEAALWSSTDENETPLDENWAVTDIREDDLHAVRMQCANFMAENVSTLARFGELVGRDAGALGHDLWLTRNHHGAGYWDRYMEAADPPSRAEAKELGQALTQAAEKLGEQYAGPLADEVTIHAG